MNPWLVFLVLMLLVGALAGCWLRSLALSGRLSLALLALPLAGAVYTALF